MALINLLASLCFELAQGCSIDKLYYEAAERLDSNDSGIS